MSDELSRFLAMADRIAELEDALEWCFLNGVILVDGNDAPDAVLETIELLRTQDGE